MEQGDAGVTLGIYDRVMQVLRLENDLGQLAVDDVLGRKLQDAGLTPKRRAPKLTSIQLAKEKPTENEPSDARLSSIPFRFRLIALLSSVEIRQSNLASCLLQSFVEAFVPGQSVMDY